VNAKQARRIDVFLAVIQKKGFTGLSAQTLQAVQEDLQSRLNMSDIARETRVVELRQPLAETQMGTHGNRHVGENGCPHTGATEFRCPTRHYRIRMRPAQVIELGEALPLDIGEASRERVSNGLPVCLRSNRRLVESSTVFPVGRLELSHGRIKNDSHGFEFGAILGLAQNIAIVEKYRFRLYRHPRHDDIAAHMQNQEQIQNQANQLNRRKLLASDWSERLNVSEDTVLRDCASNPVARRISGLGAGG
jgi:hypothetical protein